MIEKITPHKVIFVASTCRVDLVRQEKQSSRFDTACGHDEGARRNRECLGIFPGYDNFADRFSPLFGTAVRGRKQLEYCCFKDDPDIGCGFEVRSVNFTKMRRTHLEHGRLK